MTNPNNIVRLHSRNGGRGSVYEANQWAQVYGTGNLTGATVAPSSGLTVEISGSTASPSVVIAENNVGYKIALDLVTTTTLTLTAPTTNSKITAIVAYTDDLAIASEETDVTGNPATCGLIAVDGTTAASPVVPTDTQIRAGITADGATGSQAVYAVLAYITLASDTTDISNALISSPDASSALLQGLNAAYTTPSAIITTTESYTFANVTIPSAGIYLLIASIGTIDGTATDITQVNIAKNGTDIATNVGSKIERLGVARSDVVCMTTAQCNAGDTITATIIAEIGVSIRGGSTLWACRIG